MIYKRCIRCPKSNTTTFVTRCISLNKSINGIYFGEAIVTNPNLTKRASLKHGDTLLNPSRIWHHWYPKTVFSYGCYWGSQWSSCQS